MPKKKISISFVVFLALTLLRSASAEPVDLRVLIHVHSNVSGAREMDLEHLSKMAQHAKIDAVLLSDYLDHRIRISWPPQMSLIHWTFQRASISKFGFSSYVDYVRRVSQRIQSEVLLIPGAEVTPHYWWSGSLLDGNLTLHDLQKNLLVFGLDANALLRLPTRMNLDAQSKPVQEKPDIRAYQAVIDETVAQGGLSIWSTPDEAFGSNFRQGPVRFQTLPYYDSLLATAGYTGIAIFPEGVSETGAVGGIWDKVLTQFLSGRRSRPVWGFSEAVYHGWNDPEVFGKWDNVVRIDEKSENSILDAFRKGHFYLRKNKGTQLFIREFSITDPDSHLSAAMGDTLQVSTVALMGFQLAVLRPESEEKITIQLIRNGIVIEDVMLDTPVKRLVWKDEQPFRDGDKAFYRVQGMSKSGSRFLSNPIFVIKEGSAASESM